MSRFKSGSVLMTVKGKPVVSIPDDVIECIAHTGIDDFGNYTITFNLKEFRESLKDLDIDISYHLSDDCKMNRWRFKKIEEMKI